MRLGTQAPKIIIKRNPCTKRGEGLVRRVVSFNRRPQKVRIPRLKPKKRRDTTLDHSPALSGPAKGWRMDEEGKLAKDRRGTPPFVKILSLSTVPTSSTPIWFAPGSCFLPGRCLFLYKTPGLKENASSFRVENLRPKLCLSENLDVTN